MPFPIIPLLAASAPAIGAGISALVNFFSNRHNNRTQIGLQEDAQQWNQEQTDIAWQRGLEQWNRENEYNSPSAQMARLREAGINPALAYSSGVMNQAATSPDAPVPAPARAAPTQAFQMDPMLLSNMEVARAQAENLRADAALKFSQAPYYAQLIETEKKKLSDFDSQIAKRKKEMEVLDEDKKLRIAELGNIKFDQIMRGKQFMLDRKEIYARVKLYEKEGKAYEAAAARDLAQSALTNQQLKLLKDTYAEQVFGIKLQTKVTEAEFAELQAGLHAAGITVDWETGSISVDPHNSTGIRGSVWYSYANAIAGLLGEVFGMVVPVGKIGRAAKPLSQTRGYRAPGF